MKMPYVVGPPVRLPTDFFGRARQTEQFFETLAGPQVQCVSVLGLRRAGKTSFLQYISHPDVMAAFLPDPHRYLMIYVDVSACKTASEFYARVYRKLLSSQPRVPAGARRALDSADVYDVESLLYEFGERRVVLLMDEFDQLRSADFGGDFMSELRALAGIWDYELAYVTASYWDLYRLGKFVGLPPTSPFYNIFFPTPIYLSGLSPAELDELVRVPAQRVGIVADDEDVAFVRHHAGTLPFYVQATASAWLTYKAQGRAADPEAISQRLVSEMWPYFEQWWQHFSDVERDVVSAIVQEKPVERLPYSEAEVEQAVQRLANYGAIGITGSGLWMDSALFGRWLGEYTGRSKFTPMSAPMIRPSQSNGGYASKSAPFDDTFSTRLLHIIEDVGQQFERLQSVYALKSDEQLRNHLEMALRSGLADPAGGLALTAMGKTDIVARVDGLNLYAIDCTSWLGQKGLLRSIDQVLYSLTAEQARATVVVIVRNPELALVSEAITRAMPHHSGYLGYEGRRGARLDYRFHLNGDPHKEIPLTIVLVHLPG